MLRFYDPKHATTPVIRRDPLRQSRKVEAASRRFHGSAPTGTRPSKVDRPKSRARRPRPLPSAAHAIHRGSPAGRPASRPPTVEHVSDVLLSSFARNGPVSQPLTHGKSLMIDSTTLASQTPAPAPTTHNVRKCPVLSGPANLPEEKTHPPTAKQLARKTPPTLTGHPSEVSPLPASGPPSRSPSSSPSGCRSSVACGVATDWPLRAASCLRGEK